MAVEQVRFSANNHHIRVEVPVALLNVNLQVSAYSVARSFMQTIPKHTNDVAYDNGVRGSAAGHRDDYAIVVLVCLFLFAFPIKVRLWSDIRCFGLSNHWHKSPDWP
jgi:hypothetical protein